MFKYVVGLILFYFLLTTTVGCVGDIMDRADLMRTDVCHDIDHLSDIC